MSIVLKNINETALSEAEDLIADVFKDSGVDCGVGTTVRELVIRPIAALRAVEIAAQADFFNKLNLYRVADGAESDPTLVDAVASTYRLSRRQGTRAAGTILVELWSTDVDTYIPIGTNFNAANIPLFLDKTYVITNKQLTNTSDVQYIKPVLFNNTYCAIIPVKTSAGVTTVIPAGTPVSFSGSINNIARYSVLSPISGGSPVETDQELASRILYGIVGGGLSTPLQIKSTIGDAFYIKPTNIAAFGVGDKIVARSLNPVTKIAQGGFIDIYINSSSSVSNGIINAVANKVAEGTGALDDKAGYTQYSVKLDSETAAGLYEIKSITSQEGAIAKFVTSFKAVENNHKLNDITARFSAFQEAIVYFLFKGDAESMPVTIEYNYMRDIKAVQEYVDNSDHKSIFSDTVVKAAIPCFISMQLSLIAHDYNYDIDEIKQAIIKKIHSLPIGCGEINVDDIRDSITPFNMKMQFPISITGTIITPSETIIDTSVTASFSAPASSKEDYDQGAVAFFSDVNNIDVSVRVL